MTKAEERALEAYPDGSVYIFGEASLDCRIAMKNGYEQAEKDILAIIELRLSEIIGDAQPKPILRAELEELIKRIKDDY